MPVNFCHLHNHSEFSLLDGASKIKDMAKYAVQMEMPAIALTDHGVMYGAFEFYQACNKAGIKPIVGCCLPGQLIHTEHGVKPIEEIQVGEKVLTHQGEYRRVVQTMTRNYQGTIYGVQATNSETVWLTDEHPVLIRKRRKEGTHWVRADELEAGYHAKGRRGIHNWKSYVALPRLRDENRQLTETLYVTDYLDKSIYGELNGQTVKVGKFNKFDNTILQTPIPHKIPITEKLCRLLGLFIAEGSYSKYAGRPVGLCFTFGHDEANFADFVTDAIREIFDLNCAVYTRTDKRIIEVHCSNSILARLFASLCGVGCSEKYIPHFLYSASRANIAAFVEGVVDGDGRRHVQGQIAVKMANRNVIYGLRLLVASLGFAGKARLFMHGDKVRKPTYLLQWSPEGSFRKFLPSDDYLFLPLKEVQTREYDGPVYNIEVEDHHSYVTDFALHNCELYVATRKRTDRDPKRDGNHHLVALAKNETGYKNLMKLATIASLEGFYYKPRVDKECLAELSEGLIICSACMGGELAKAIVEGRGSLEQAKNVAAWYREVFKDDFYLEVQGHAATGQKDINEAVLSLSQQMGIKMVATNDSHYLKAEDASAHDVLICIQTGTTVEDPKRMRYEPREFYLKTHEEMLGNFDAKFHDAIANTCEIAEKVNLKIETGRVAMPQIGLLPGKNADETAEELCWEGLERRLPNHSDVHKDRLKYELGVIQQMGFSQYFLIVRDISNYARGSGIYFGVRGSAAGSLASYCLGITDLDPVEYNLTFERFLNPERVTMPDIDMDFQDDRRGDVIRHVTQQYGKDQVSYITTFGTLGAKAALRDAGRALALPLPEVDRIAKMIPALPLGLSIDKAMHGAPEKEYHGNPEMRNEYENSELARKLIDTARRIEGITRTESVHAAGIMICDRPLVEYTPLRKLNDGSTATQYPHSSLETIGLLKMDFLGLINLTILARSVKLIKETRNEDIDVWDIPLDGATDPRAKRAYDMLGRGETIGIFQLESQGMRKYIVDLKPASVKELAAMVALYRPGPLAHIPRYIRSKFNPDQIQYSTHERANELLEPILKETYGVIVYQDQVLKIVQALGGLSLGQADILRRAMGKKQIDYMMKQKGIFLDGAKERGVPKDIAEGIFADIEPFAGYAFNGAHAACYAMVAYQTAYLKANYTAEYLAALMSAYIEKTDKIIATFDEVSRFGLSILPPDVNESSADFTVACIGDAVESGIPNAIRFGLQAIKNVGKLPVDSILAAREKGGKFTSLDDFCTRIFAEGLTSKSVVEMLIKAGTLASIHPNRRALLEALEDCWVAAARGAKEAAAGLISLFGEATPEDAAGAGSLTEIPNVADFSRGERLGFEKELLGLYLTEHPVKPFEPEIRRKYRASRCDSLKETQPNQEITIGGMITAVRTSYTKAGQPMLFLTVEDTSGTLSATCFTKTTSEYAKFLVQNAVVVLKGKAQHRERIVNNDAAAEDTGERTAQVEMIVEKVEQISANAMASDARLPSIHVRVDGTNKTLLRMLKETLGTRDGGSPVYIHVDSGPTEYLVKTKLLISADDALISQVRQMLGGGNKRVWVE